jgi:4a-hydroxytetrahydrobiopterin dehydratase
MSRPVRLSEDEIIEYLKDLPLWNHYENSIIREYAMANFPAAIGIVNSIAILAETMDHHPDILVYGWNKVRITLSTHDQGGLTEFDFGLARKIEELSF